MTPRDIALAVSVAVVWGLVFIAIKIGVAETSPLMLSALRFVFAAAPGVLLVRPPRASAWKVALYGLLIGVGQFGVLFIAIGQGFPVGLASLIIQLQAYFTILFAWTALGEAPTRIELVGAAVAFVGMAAIGYDRLAGASFGPFALVVAAALFWGLGNVVAKTARGVDMFAFTIWSSLAPPVPLALMALAVDGPQVFVRLLHPTLALVLSVATVSYAGTLFGYGLWARLLGQYSAAAVAPFALLVPIVGMLAGALLFHERLGAVELSGGLLVMAGLALNVFGERMFRRRAAAR